MPIPDDLATWRAFLSQPAPEPPPRPARLSRLSKKSRTHYNEMRFEYLASDIVMETPDLIRVRQLTTLLAIEAHTSSTLSSRGIALSGAPSWGKTTAAITLARQHDRDQRARDRSTDDPDFQPTIYVVTPPATTPKMMMIAYCQFLGLPYRQRDTAQELADRVVFTLRKMRTSMVVVDEVHNLHSNRRIGAEAASTSKLFAERLDAVFLYAGVNLRESETFAGAMGQQLASRMLHHEMAGYENRSQRGRDDWERLLVTCEHHLLLYKEQPQDILEYSNYLYDRTAGSVGELRSLLRRAAFVAINDGTEHLTKAVLDIVPTSRSDTDTTLLRDARPRSATR